MLPTEVSLGASEGWVLSPIGVHPSKTGGSENGRDGAEPLRSPNPEVNERAGLARTDLRLDGWGNWKAGAEPRRSATTGATEAGTGVTSIDFRLCGLGIAVDSRLSTAVLGLGCSL